MIMKIFFTIIIFYLSLVSLLYAEEDIDKVSNSLYEYAVSRYRLGDTADAIHELKKCLMINPEDFKCSLYLKLITDGLQVKPEASAKMKVRPKIYFNPRIKACVNQEVSFLAKIDPEVFANRLNYKWDFGDGKSAVGRRVKKTYSQAGIYIVKLTAYDALSKRSISFKRHRVRVYSPPIADAGESIIGCVGRYVFFDASRSKVTNMIERCFNCDMLTCTWNFGDGSAEAQGAKVRHIFNKPGRYTATLTVQDGKNRKCSLVKDSVLVLVYAKPSFILKEIQKSCVGKSIDFRAYLKASDGYSLESNSLKYTWDFGDGTVIEAGSKVSHTYTKGGEYLVEVKVDDKLATACSTDIQVMRIKVNTALQ